MARVFDGDDHISYGHLAGFDGAAQVALSFWIYPVATATNWDTALAQLGANTSGTGEASGIAALYGGSAATTFLIACRNNDSGAYQTYSSFYTLDAWQHVFVQFDGTEGTALDRVKVYRSGSLVTSGRTQFGTNPTTIGTNNQPFALGWEGTRRYWSGRLAGVVAWQGVVLDSTARTALAAGTLTGISEGNRVVFDGLWNGTTPTNLITAAAATVTNTTETTDPSGLEAAPSSGNRRRRLLLCGR